MTPSERLALMQSSMAAAMPARAITRDLKDFSDRASAELSAGVFTLISKGEGGYRNYNGREAMDGRHRMLLVGQIQLGEDAAPSAVEDAELAMIEDVKAFMRALPVGLCSVVMTGFTQSGQLEVPYGWVVIELEAFE